MVIVHWWTTIKFVYSPSGTSDGAAEDQELHPATGGTGAPAPGKIGGVTDARRNVDEFGVIHGGLGGYNPISHIIVIPK